jgi:uncharacterized protein
VKKHFLYCLAVYILMQLSGVVGVPLLYYIGVEYLDQAPKHLEEVLPGYWLIISFSVSLVVIWFILNKSKDDQTRLERSQPLSMGLSLLLAIGGVFMAFFAQGIAIQIEYALGIEMGSENTEMIIDIIETVPISMMVAAVIGPILEEIVFRKIIFGSLYERFPFFLSALISSVIFAFAHFEPEHVILYSAMGFTFAFLYVVSKRIIVPIIAHVSMNTMVVLMQSIFREDIEKLMKEAENLPGFIGGLF